MRGGEAPRLPKRLRRVGQRDQSAIRSVRRVAEPLAGSPGAAGSGQSQPTEGHGDQPQHQGHGATDYSAAGAGTTFGDGQIQPAVDHGDQPRHQGHDGPHSPVTGADTTGGSAQSQPTDDHADQRQHSDRGGPESPGSQAVNRGGGWLGNVRGHQHGMHKPPEQGGGSQGDEDKSEGSFHRSSQLTYSARRGFVPSRGRSVPDHWPTSHSQARRNVV